MYAAATCTCDAMRVDSFFLLLFLRVKTIEEK